MTSSSSTDPRCTRCGSVRVSRHMTPLLPECEADVWVPVREECYMCGDCTLIESRFDNADDFLGFRERWNDPVRQLTPEQLHEAMERRRQLDEEEDRAWTWPTESRATDRETRIETLDRVLEDRTYSVFATIDSEVVWKRSEERRVGKEGVWRRAEEGQG